VISKIQNPNALLLLLESTEDELIKKEIENKLEKKEGGWKVKNPNLLTGTNISVCISDRFMEAVKEKKE
jgi:ribonucleoside-diphosphate reductase alpha chain